MLNKEIIIRRLALIKYLFRLGVEQAKQIEPLSAFSILNFHDAVEMFLKLLAEKLNIKTDKFNFIDYWEEIPELTLKESMRNLNTRRVNIKHKWIFPSKTDIDISKINTTEFFQQNTESQFNIVFDEISLLELINYKETKEYLTDAQSSLVEWKFEKCIEACALWFYELMYTYEGKKKNYFRGWPLSLVQDFNSFWEFKIREFDQIKESLNEIQNALKIIGFGIDYKRYIKFKILMPHVFHSMAGPQIMKWGTGRNKKWSKENCEYCIDFVIESCLKLQEFDFEINELEY